MSDELAAVVVARRAQRWASRKELRALSDTIADSTGDARGAEARVLRRGWILRPIANGEWILISPTTHVAIACKVRDSWIVSHQQELPDDVHAHTDEVPYVLLCIDQGSIGM